MGKAVAGEDATPTLIAYLEQAVAEIECLVEASRADPNFLRGKGSGKNRAWLKAMDDFMAGARDAICKARGLPDDAAAVQETVHNERGESE